MQMSGHPVAIVIDTLPLRGAAFAALLTLWLAPAGYEILSVTGEGLVAGQTAFIAPALLVVSVGGLSLDSAPLRLVIGQLRAAYPRAPLAVVSDVLAPEEAVCAARIGVHALIPTTVPPDLAERVLAFVVGGGSYFPREALLRCSQRVGAGPIADGGTGSLTLRQGDVLERLRLGRSNKLIGRDLDMSEATVKVHVRQIMRKLGAANRTQAALLGDTHPAAEQPVLPEVVPIA